MKIGGRMSKNRQTNVLFIWDVRDELKKYLQQGVSQYPEVNLIFPEKITDDEFLGLAQDVNIIVGWRPSKELLLQAKKANLFINPGAGIQHLIGLFKEVNRIHPISLVNGHGNSYFTAQHVVALLLSLTNKVIPHHNWMIEGEWRKGDSDAQTIPLRYRKIGLLGYGAVNQKVHQFLSGFDVEFAILRRNWDKNTVKIIDAVKKFSYTDLHPFLEEIDILIVGVPITSETKNLIKSEELRLLGPEGLVMNISRGPVIEEESLFLALKEKTIKGAAIDVWYDYQPAPDTQGKKYPYSYPFHTLDNVVLSPHRGASPMDDLQRWDEVIENISRFTQGRQDFLNLVDLDLEY